MKTWIYLGMGSLVGGLARYHLTGLVHNRLESTFPYGTLAVNLTGCFLIGLLDNLAEEKFLLGPHARLLLMTGFCGAFTTFSTFILETSHLLRGGETTRALANVLFSVVAGFLLFRLGVALARVF